jgi:hypothetical protein
MSTAGYLYQSTFFSLNYPGGHIVISNEKEDL